MLAARRAAPRHRAPQPQLPARRTSAPSAGASRSRVRSWRDTRAPGRRRQSASSADVRPATVADLAALRMRPVANGARRAARRRPAVVRDGLRPRHGHRRACRRCRWARTWRASRCVALARLQSEVDDPEKDAEPGKILHETALRQGRGAELELPVLRLRRLDAALPHAARRDVPLDGRRRARARARAEPRAARWPGWRGPATATATATWSSTAAPRAGSRCSAGRTRGTRCCSATARSRASPLAVCEVQGYAYAARLALAEVARAAWGDAALGRPSGARRRGAARARSTATSGSTGDGGYYALALDAEKRPVDSLTSNLGHLLWTGIAKPERVRGDGARADVRRHVLRLGRAHDEHAQTRGYNPIEYHDGTVWPHDTSIACAGLARHGFREEAVVLHHALLEAARALRLAPARGHRRLPARRAPASPCRTRPRARRRPGPPLRRC